jgi:hypothetical protein
MRKKNLVVALVAGLLLTGAAQPVERTELAPMGPSSWFIFSVETKSRPSWPENTVLITLSMRPDQLSVPSGVVFYDGARLPDLLAHYGVSIPVQLTSKVVSITDRRDPVLEPIVKVGMSMSNIPDPY